MDFVYDSGVQLAGRKPALWLIQKGKIHAFIGDTIPGVVEVTDEDRRTLKPDGSWGVSEYYLNLAEEVVPCLLLSSVHGRLWPEEDTESAHRRFKKQFGVKVSKLVFTATLERYFPLTYERMLLGYWDPWRKGYIKTDQSES